MTDDTRRMVEEAMREKTGAASMAERMRFRDAVDVAAALVEKERACHFRAHPVCKQLYEDYTAMKKALAEARDRWGHIAHCNCRSVNWLDDHNERDPRCVPPPAAEPTPETYSDHPEEFDGDKPTPERCGTCGSDDPGERLVAYPFNPDDAKYYCDNEAFHSQPPARKETRDGE